MDATEKIEKWSRKRNADKPKGELERAVSGDAEYFNGEADFRKLEGRARSDFADEWIKIHTVQDDLSSFERRADALKQSQKKEAKEMLVEFDKYVAKLEESDPAVFEKTRRGLGQTRAFLDSIAQGKKGLVLA